MTDAHLRMSCLFDHENQIGLTCLVVFDFLETKIQEVSFSNDVRVKITDFVCTSNN